MSENEHLAWQDPLLHPKLERQQVHLWRANLDLSPTEVAPLASLLSSDEISRANRFRFLDHQRHFTVARGILRQLLGNYLQIKPVDLEFRYGDRGKPSLAGSALECLLQFNVSHSQGYALYGFTRDGLIGVDIEHLREMPDAAKIAQRFFSTREFDLIASLQGQQRQNMFFKLWTAKEAYLKATGTGLAGSLADVEIFFDQGGYPYLKAIYGDGSSSSIVYSTEIDWSIHPCTPTAKYLGAIAIKARITPQQINYWNWTPRFL